VAFVDYSIVLIELLPQPELRNMMNSSDERRKHMRFSVPPHELFVYCRATQRMMMVMDISMGGFKIECYPSAEIKPDSMNVDIYSLPQERFQMAGIPCRVVYNIANLAEDGTFSGSNSRISGFEFQKLTAEQRDKLQHFLDFMDPDL
jgi:hypothetical protein